MLPFFEFLQSQPFLLIFSIVALGMALGRVMVGGISLGSVVCILLVGLILSMWSFQSTGVPLALPDQLKTVFFNLFIFAAGIKIGPQFFSGLERDGWHMVVLGLVVAVLAPVLSLLCGWLFTLPQGAVAGLLAGSNNSSASFGTATAALQSGALRLPPGGLLDLVSGTLSAAFALCYAVSEVQFVLFMKWLPAFAHVDPVAAARAFEGANRKGHASPLPGTSEASDYADVSISVRAYRLTAQAAAGRTIGEIRSRAPHVSIELVRRGSQWLTVETGTALESGDEVIIEAPLSAHVRVREALGPELPDAEARSLIPTHTVDVVVGRDEAAGKSLPDLLASLGPGLYPNAVFRAGEELSPGAETILKVGDVIRVTGTDAHIDDLGKQVGQVVRASHSSDVLTLAIGVSIGALIGAIPVPLFGVRVSFGAAAVLIVGIVFGWLKTRHPALGGPISEGARRLLEEMGLNVFTAVLAINSGQSVYQVMNGGPVWALIASCFVVSAVPAMVAWWIGRRVLGVNPALLMGAIAGARQNTASLHVAQKASQSAVPGIGYPVPLAITTVALSVVSYFFAIFS